MHNAKEKVWLAHLFELAMDFFTKNLFFIDRASKETYVYKQ